jgi:PleD family two-component response regulator
MAHKSTFAMRPLGTRKRVLLVSDTLGDAEQRSAFLRSRGYEVDSTVCSESAISLSRSHSYDLIVVPVDIANCHVDTLCRKLQRLNPNSTIACLADCKKPLPAMPPDRLLWKGEPLEYFTARLDALAATA